MLTVAHFLSDCCGAELLCLFLIVAVGYLVQGKKAAHVAAVDWRRGLGAGIFGRRRLVNHWQYCNTVKVSGDPDIPRSISVNR